MNIEAVPPEIVAEIFAYLDIDEIKTCRLVNKQFRSVVNNCLRLRELVISNKRIISNRWSFTNELISHLNWIKNVAAPGFSSRSDLFKTIKKLFIETTFSSSIQFYNSTPRTEFNLLTNLVRQINEFKQLERVEIVAMDGMNDAAGELQISLPKLTFFNIGLTRFQTVRLDAPRLLYVKTSQLPISKIHVVQPLTVKHLEIEYYEPAVKNFKKLENLYCKRFDKVEPDLLMELVELKKIHFIYNIELVPQFRQLKSKKNNLNVYFYGLDVSRIFNPSPKLSYNTELDDKNLLYLIENSACLADDLPFFKILHYSKLENKRINSYAFVKQEVLNKFNCLTQLSVDRAVHNRSLLTSLLGYCSNLQKLEISYSAGLSAKFFNQLPQLQPNLEWLGFEARKRSIKLDLETVFKLKRLMVLKLNKRFHTTDLRSFCDRVFKETKLRIFGFYFRHTDSEIRHDNGKFSLSVEYDTDNQFYDSLDDIFELFDGPLEDTFDLYAYKRRRDCGPSSDESDYDPKRKGKSKYEPDTDSDPDEHMDEPFRKLIKLFF